MINEKTFNINFSWAMKNSQLEFKIKKKIFYPKKFSSTDALLLLRETNKNQVGNKSFIEFALLDSLKFLFLTH